MNLVKSAFVSSLLAFATVGVAQTATYEPTCGQSYTLKNNGPVTMAVCAGDVAAVKELTAATGVNVPDPTGLLPLAVAFSSSTVYWQPVAPNLLPVIDYLLSAGADVNIALKGNNAASPLGIAAVIGDEKLVAALIAAGADVNFANANGNTPLHEAAFCDFRLGSDQSSVAVINLLTAHQADLHAKNKNGATPFESVGTPCSFEPADCTDQALASSKSWPTGSCKQTYLLLRKLSANQ